MTHDLTRDPAVAKALEGLKRWYGYVRVNGAAPDPTERDWNALITAVVAAHENWQRANVVEIIRAGDERLADLLALWSAWKEARDDYRIMGVVSEDIPPSAAEVAHREQVLRDAEAALAAWRDK